MWIMQRLTFIKPYSYVYFSDVRKVACGDLAFWLVANLTLISTDLFLIQKSCDLFNSFFMICLLFFHHKNNTQNIGTNAVDGFVEPSHVHIILPFSIETIGSQWCLFYFGFSTSYLLLLVSVPAHHRANIYMFIVWLIVIASRSVDHFIRNE